MSTAFFIAPTSAGVSNGVLPQSAGFGHASVLVDTWYQGLGGFETIPCPTVERITYGGGGEESLPYAHKFVIPWEHRAAAVTLHYADGTTSEVTLPGDLAVLVINVRRNGSGTKWRSLAIPITEEAIPAGTYTFVNLTGSPFGTNHTGSEFYSTFTWQGGSTVSLNMEDGEYVTVPVPAPWNLPRDEPPPFPPPAEVTTLGRMLVSIAGGPGLDDNVLVGSTRHKSFMVYFFAPDVSYDPKYAFFQRGWSVSSGTGTQYDLGYTGREYFGPWLGEA